MSDTKSTLLAILPLLFIIIALVTAIIVLPQTNLDIRDKAAQPTPTLIPQPIKKPTISPSYQLQPETACSSLYSPVCASDAKTYPNECEANKAGVKIVYSYACTTPLRSTPTPTFKALPSAY